MLESEAHRLTLVQAGTGYGKSTALAALAEDVQPFAWYHLAAEDADPVVFLLHLYHAFSTALSGLPETPLASLEEWEQNRSTDWRCCLQAAPILFGSLVWRDIQLSTGCCLHRSGAVYTLWPRRHLARKGF